MIFRHLILPIMSKTKQKPQRGPTHFWEIWGSITAFAVMTLFGALPAYRGTQWDPEKAGQFGDFVAGYFGTVFLVVSVAVLFGSYRNQRFSNQVAAFESRFFELLRYHRDNTVEIEVESIKGRRAFVSFIREWRLLLPLVEKSADEVSVMANAVPVRLSVKERAILSYLAFYHGSGPNARRTFREAARPHYEAELVEEVLKQMSAVWVAYPRSASGAPDLHAEEEGGKDCKSLAYVPFEGHHSRLAHYFRHLFHLVEYAASHAPHGTAKEYVDLVRAQLTTHEQALLALHAASVEGAWRTQNYLQARHLIEDIPIGFLSDEEFPVREVLPMIGPADANL